MDLFLRKVIHPQAHDNYRVVVRDGDEIEIGSIGVQFDGWTWGIASTPLFRCEKLRPKAPARTVRTA